MRDLQHGPDAGSLCVEAAFGTYAITQYILSSVLSRTKPNKSLPDIAELVVHVPHVIFHVDGDTGRLQHLHGELLGEGTNKQSSDSVDAGDLIRHADLFGLVPVLQVQYTCRQKGRGAAVIG